MPNAREVKTNDRANKNESACRRNIRIHIRSRRTLRVVDAMKHRYEFVFQDRYSRWYWQGDFFELDNIDAQVLAILRGWASPLEFKED